MKDFTNKVAVITGGASGVGRSLAFALGRKGARIVIGDVDKGAMEQVEKDLAAENIPCTVQFCDVTKAESLEALADAALETFDSIDLVFANAGIGAGESGTLWEYSDKDWQWCFNVNLWGVVNTINVFMPKLVERNQPSHFVITGSGNGGLIVLPDQPIYTATKAAVQTITENLHFQAVAGNLPVKVSALFPGPYVVETGLFNSGRVRPDEFRKEGNAGENASGINSVEDLRKVVESYGMELQSTHPDEVAEMAVEGLENDAFWLLKTSPETEDKIRRRAQMVLNRETPMPESVGA